MRLRIEIRGKLMVSFLRCCQSCLFETLCLLKHCISGNPKLTHHLRPADQPRGATIFVLPAPADKCAPPHPAFYAGSGAGTQVLTLAQQADYYPRLWASVPPVGSACAVVLGSTASLFRRHFFLLYVASAG